MSLDAYNSIVTSFAKDLPGREDEATDTSRGYVGWGPLEDAMDRSRSIEHADWDAVLGAIQNPAREIHDFYFEVETPSVKCDCCAGSGVNKDYEELDRGFYRHGGGRWAGWGERLFQNEIDELVAKKRIGRNAEPGSITPENLKRHLGVMGHDAINRWCVLPIRAKNLGLDCNPCYDCAGTGMTPTDSTKLRLHIWTFNPESGKSRCDSAMDVKMDQVEEIREYLNEIGWEGVRRRFGWASGDNLYSEIRYDSNFKRAIDQPFVQKDSAKRVWWTDSLAYDSFDEFRREFIGGDPDLNLVFDYRILASDSHVTDNPYSGSELPEEKFGLALWMSHPRKGASRTILVSNCSEDDGQELKEFLKKSYDVHGRHFAWATGRPFGNEKVAEAEAVSEEPYDAVKFFTGR